MSDLGSHWDLTRFLTAQQLKATNDHQLPEAITWGYSSQASIQRGRYKGPLCLLVTSKWLSCFVAFFQPVNFFQNPTVETQGKKIQTGHTGINKSGSLLWAKGVGEQAPDPHRAGSQPIHHHILATLTGPSLHPCNTYAANAWIWQMLPEKTTPSKYGFWDTSLGKLGMFYYFFYWVT